MLSSGSKSALPSGRRGVETHSDSTADRIARGLGRLESEVVRASAEIVEARQAGTRDLLARCGASLLFVRLQHRERSAFGLGGVLRAGWWGCASGCGNELAAASQVLWMPVPSGRPWVLRRHLAEQLVSCTESPAVVAGSRDPMPIYRTLGGG